MSMFIKHTHLMEEEADDCIVLFDSEVDKTHILNESAAWLWKHMPEHKFDPEELIKQFISSLENLEELNISDIHHDCMEYFQNMIEENLLSESN